MQSGLTDTTNPNIYFSISNETEINKRPTRIRLSTSSNDYIIHNLYIEKYFFTIVIYLSYFSKNEPQLHAMCLKTYDIGHWPSLIFKIDVSITPF